MHVPIFQLKKCLAEAWSSVVDATEVICTVHLMILFTKLAGV